MTAPSSPYGQVLTCLAFDREHPETFLATLDVRPPALADEFSLRQLCYLAYYLADPIIDCKAFLIENHYIDRDHMEDHSVFYSRTFYPYPNYCRRVHFFSIAPSEVGIEIDRLRRSARSDGRNGYLKNARELSDRIYIGFSVLKPLTGTPVGRTVIKAFPEAKKGEPDYHRLFSGSHTHQVHVAGVTLFVKGIPFQQQDKAVAACATTAIWSALHRARELENLAPFTPAQITALASRNSLPFGRPMPSEGLSVDQMCQAVQSMGVSPVLRRAENFDNSRALLYSAVRSGIAPVLVITDGRQWHAVAVTGMGTREKEVPDREGVRDGAACLEALYLHDDRVGPYLKADIQSMEVLPARTTFPNVTIKQPPLVLAIQFDQRQGTAAQRWLIDETDLEDQRWLLSHILFPMHPKVRITFGELREIAIQWLAAEIDVYREEVAGTAQTKASSSIFDFETWIAKSSAYQEGLLLRQEQAPDMGVVTSLAENVSLPRYVGVIRFEAEDFDRMDFLVDTTTTERNLHAIALVVHAATKDFTMGLADYLSRHFECRLVASSGARIARP